MSFNTHFKKYPNIIFTTSKTTDGNMSFLHGVHDEVLKNRKEFFKSLQIPTDSIVAMQLQHDTNIAVVGKNNLGKGIYIVEDALLADALITSEPNIFLFVLTSDCIPLALFNPVKQVLALVHISWKTADKNLLKLVIQKLSEKYASQPQNLIAEFGPSIGPCCYKHLPDLTQKDDPRWKPYISQAKDGTFGINLWGFTENELKNLGLKPENIHNPKVCTYHTDKYFSYRKVQVENLKEDYRIATVLGIKS